MKKLGLLAVVAAGSALAATGIYGSGTTPPDPSGIVVVDAPPSAPALPGTAGAADGADPAETPVVGVTLPESIYFATCWWQLQQAPFVAAPIVLGNGYSNANVVFSDDGNFFAGTVEKRDSGGRITDVLLAFAGAKKGSGANAEDDVINAQEMSYNLPSAEAQHAAALYASLWTNPTYSHARIHVMGHSLGAGFTQYVLGYSLATYGRASTVSRADFIQFGVPGYSQGIATHFGLTVSDFDGLITGYNAKNDPTPSDLPPGGVAHGARSVNSQLMGAMHWLADYQPYGTNPAYSALNGLSAHESLTFTAAFGLPSWLTPAQQQAVISTVIAAEPTGDKYDPNYGSAGSVSQSLIGDGADNRLTGTASDDTLQGGAGADILTGGGGRNSFIYTAASDSPHGASDVITDFKPGDTIDLSGMGLNSAFAFVGAQRPTSARQVGYEVIGGSTFVEVNTSGGTTPDMVIELSGRHALDATSFALGGTLSDAASYVRLLLLNTTGDPFLDHVLVGFSLT